MPTCNLHSSILPQEHIAGFDVSLDKNRTTLFKPHPSTNYKHTIQITQNNNSKDKTGYCVIDKKTMSKTHPIRRWCQGTPYQIVVSTCTLSQDSVNTHSIRRQCQRTTYQKTVSTCTLSEDSVNTHLIRRRYPISKSTQASSTYMLST